jgi:hypothetical protein
MVSLAAQQLQKGNLVGLHTVKVTLKPGVTMDEFVRYWTEEYVPAFNSMDQGWKLIPLKSLRGEVPKDNLGMLFIINSEKDRDKFYNPDGSPSDISKVTDEKMKSYNDKMDKLATTESIYTDWIVTGNKEPLSQHDLKKGNLLGTHVIKVELKPGVTMEQYSAALNDKMSPEFTKVVPTWHSYVLKKVRGDAKEDYGLLYVVDSEKDRDKYFNPDGTSNEEMAKASQQLKSQEEINKLGSYTSVWYADWVIL